MMTQENPKTRTPPHFFAVWSPFWNNGHEGFIFSTCYDK